MKRFALLSTLLLVLCGCSYSYNLTAVVRGGHLIFEVSTTSGQQPPCFRQIEVSTDTGPKGIPGLGDDLTLVRNGAYWFESVSYDDACTNRFPVAYGAALRGTPLSERGKVIAKALRREVVYDVVTTSGATGYGSGRFIIHANGQVENLSDKLIGSASNEASNASSR